MVEGARLESVYTATYRGFESLSLRHQAYRQVILSPSILEKTIYVSVFVLFGKE